MTENEAKNIIIENRPFVGSKELQEAVCMAIQALEEIQQYRAIGTVEECQSAVERMKPRKPHKCKTEYDDLLEMDYKQNYCACGHRIYQVQKFCEMCGQALDWSE